MATPIYYTGDTWPPLQGVARDAAGAAVDISTMTAMRAVSKPVGASPVIAGTAVFRPIARGGTGDGTDGKWEYVWGATDLSAADTYVPELEVTWPGGPPTRIETFRDDSVQFIVKADND